MNNKNVLFLLGATCLLALVQLSAGVDNLNPAIAAKAAAAASAADGKPVRGPHGGPGGKGFDFRKEVERIFDEFKVDANTRDQILDRIKQRMEELHEKGGFRRRKEGGKGGKGGKGKGGDKDSKQ